MHTACNEKRNRRMRTISRGVSRKVLNQRYSEKMPWRLLWVFVVFLGHCIFALKFSSVTGHVRLGGARGKVVGFVDFNADKATDVLFQTGNNVSVYLWNGGKQRFHLHHLTHSSNGSVVVHTEAMDVDADGQVDLLTLSREDEVEGCHSMKVHWVRPHTGGPVIDKSEVIAEHILSPPLVLDANGDHIPDLLTHSCLDQTATVWISRGFLREFRTHTVPSPFNYSRSYYVDLTDDYLADVVVDGYGPNGRSLVFWQRNPSCSDEISFLYPSLPVPLPLPTAAVTSPLSFNDIDGDGEIEAIGLTCADEDCATVSAHILSSSSASHNDCGDSGTQPVNFTLVHTVSVPGVSLSPFSISSHPPVLGDIDLDGLPDVLLPVSSSSGVLLLATKQCRGNCDGSKVTLEPQWISVTNGNVTSVFFFDLWEDGVLDVLVMEEREPETSEQLLAFRHHLQDDHAFLKILVLSGHCYHDCRSGQMPYGSVLPGVVVRFSTKDRMGRRKEGVRTLISGHTHQLPFTVFGLGQTPSLVERLEVGVEGEGVAASRRWTNLVPNSQIIVIPSPPSQPLRWRLELYLTPGNLVYSTAGVLAALFLATAVLVLLLQAREKYQDTRERKMAKHKFHFNAM